MADRPGAITIKTLFPPERYSMEELRVATWVAASCKCAKLILCIRPESDGDRPR